MVVVAFVTTGDSFLLDWALIRNPKYTTSSCAHPFLPVLNWAIFGVLSSQVNANTFSNSLYLNNISMHIGHQCTDTYIINNIEPPVAQTQKDLEVIISLRIVYKKLAPALRNTVRFWKRFREEQLS